jgi:hypothetical protein
MHCRPPDFPFYPTICEVIDLEQPQKITRRFSDTLHSLSFACLMGSLVTTPAFDLQNQSVIDLGVDLRPADTNNGTETGSCKTGAPACPDGAAACLAILRGSTSSP